MLKAVEQYIPDNNLLMNITVDHPDHLTPWTKAPLAPSPLLSDLGMAVPNAYGILEKSVAGVIFDKLGNSTFDVFALLNKAKLCLEGIKKFVLNLSLRSIPLCCLGYHYAVKFCLLLQYLCIHATSVITGSEISAGC